MFLSNVLLYAGLIRYHLKVQAAQTLPLTSLHQFLKFNGTPEIKRELITEDGVIETVSIANADDQVGSVLVTVLGISMFSLFFFCFNFVYFGSSKISSISRSI